MPRASAASLDGQPGEVAELDQLGRLRGRRRPAGSRASSRASRSSARLGRGELGVGRGRPAAGRRRACRPACGGRCSTRMRRMASAAAAKKWPRLFQCRAASPPTSRRYASWTRAVAWSVWPGLLLGQPRGGQLAQLVVDEREQVGGGPAVAGRGGVEEAGDVGHVARVYRIRVARARGISPSKRPLTNRRTLTRFQRNREK